MQSFTDTKQRTWLLDINYAAIRRVKALVGVDLLKLHDGEPPLLSRLAIDIELLVNVIFALIQPDAEQRGVTDEQFGEALGGDAIADAHAAFWEGLKGFFQKPRPDVARMIETQQVVMKAGVVEAEKQATTIDPKKMVQNAFGKLPESLLGLSVSPPTAN